MGLPTYRCGHYDGKGRIGEWILQQNQDNQDRMKAALFTTGPYMEMAISKHTAMPVSVEPSPDTGAPTAVWRLPLLSGAIPFVSLDDCGPYVKWLFDHPTRANGLDLSVAIAHVSAAELSGAFTKVTGRPAQVLADTPLDEYFSKVWPVDPDLPAAYNADPKDPATLSVRQNFTGFWNSFRHSAGNKGVIKRDYALLDEIHPGRIRSAEEFFRREDEKGVRKGLGTLWERVQPDAMAHVLKLSEDSRTGKL